MLIDLHTHTHPGSWDSYLLPDELVERSKQAGLDAIVLSEHDWAWDPEEVKALAKRHNFIVIPAMEINTEDGHMLVYGMHKYVFGMHRAHELMGHVNEVDGVMVAAHPYRRHHPWQWDKEKEWEDALVRSEENEGFRLIVAMEVLNGRGKQNENQMAARIADRLQFHGTAGTDSHATTDIGKCATYFERDVRNERDLITELRAGRFWPLDLIGGGVGPDPRYLALPDDVHAIWRGLDEGRAEYLARLAAKQVR